MKKFAMISAAFLVIAWSGVGSLHLSLQDVPPTYYCESDDPSNWDYCVPVVGANVDYMTVEGTFGNWKDVSAETGIEGGRMQVYWRQHEGHQLLGNLAAIVGISTGIWVFFWLAVGAWKLFIAGIYQVIYTARKATKDAS